MNRFIRGIVLLTTLLVALAGCSTPASVKLYGPGLQPVRISRAPPPHTYSVRSPQMERDLEGHLGSPVEQGNLIEPLINGDAIFPAMLEAIRQARETINFETFVYWSGDIGAQMAEALASRARAGVKVHILLDYVGTYEMETRLLEMLADSGAVIEKYHPLSWFGAASLDHRTHRKLLIIDGRIGFTGGVGIAPQWTGDAQDPDHWRDNHYRITGPVVAHMQTAFLSNWVVADGDQMAGDGYFPALTSKGSIRAQMLHSAGYGGGRNMQALYLLAIAAAETSIDLETAYFVPDSVANAALIDARKRGVKVRILVPGPYIDKSSVRAASRHAWGPLLEAGVEIHEYTTTMLHAKLLVVDGYLTSVGSSNFDNRSFKINDEANINVFDAAFAQHQTRQFEIDLKRGKPITLAQWQQRPLTERVAEYFATAFADEL